MSHSELRHPQLNLLPGDTLTILCEISITGDNVVTSGTSKYFMISLFLLRTNNVNPI